MKKIVSLILSIMFVFAPLVFAGEQQVEIKKYVFDDNAQASNASEIAEDALKGYVGKISAGTKFSAYLRSPVNTATASKGDNINAVLSQDWVYGNKLIASQGSVVYGTITKANRASYGYRNGSVQINFTQIATPDGRTYDIKAEKVDFKVDSTGKLGNAAGKVAAGAAIGILGSLLALALSSGDKSVGKAVAIGAGVGAGTGLLTAAAEKGVDAEIPAYTEIEIVLEKPLNISFLY